MWCESPTRLDALRRMIADYSRDELIDQILHYPSRTLLDFTRHYLEQQPTERLQHLLLCAMAYLPPHRN